MADSCQHDNDCLGFIKRVVGIYDHIGGSAPSSYYLDPRCRYWRGSNVFGAVSALLFT